MAADTTPSPQADARTGAENPDPPTDAAPKKTKKAKKAKSPGLVLPPLGVFPLSGKLAYAGAIISGLLYWLSFAGMDVWPLAFVAFIPLFLAIQRQTAKRALWLGVVTGMTMNVFGFYWLQEMLKTFSGFPTPVCFLFVLIVCAYQGGRLGLMGWLYARSSARGWPAQVAFIVAFAASELLYPLLFPWYFAASVHQVPVLTQTAELGGPILVGVILLAANLALAEPILARLEGRKPRVLAIAPGLGVLLVAIIFGAVRVSQVDARVAAAPKVKVGVVQGNLGLMQKREDPGEGLRRHRRLTEELRVKGAEFVVWSESSVTFPVPEQWGNDLMHDRVGRHLGMPAIFGGVYYRVDPDRERWFNTALSTDKTGKVNARYDKTYLLLFGEKLPFGDTFPVLYQWSPHSGRFSSGTKLDSLIIDTDAPHVVSTLICYEDILPSFTNSIVSHGNPELLVNTTNDAWFGDTTEPWEHLALAKFRTIEHRRFMVRSTNSGVSAVIDPVGRAVSHTKTFQPDTLLETVRWMRSTTLYELVGDVPIWMTAIFAVVSAFVRRRRLVAVSR